MAQPLQSLATVQVKFSRLCPQPRLSGEYLLWCWHDRLKKRGLAKPEPASTGFHRVAVKPIESPVVIGDESILLRFHLPNGIDCEVAGIKPDGYASFLGTLARLRL
ncbi:MAG: hypothetical protein ABL933_10995 [Methyloglobulus sp.]|nr:hypothetical protein [Methyloglobulus sp.]